MNAVPRYDYYSLRPMTKLPHTGFLLCEGVAAKEGVLRYQEPNGTVRRELVTREDTLSADSLATLPLVKFTEEHPDVPVDSTNVAQFGKGTVLDEVTCHNGFVVVRFVVDSAETIDAIHNDGLRELSPGYEVELDMTPGVHPVFGEYDAIQRNRVYNHLAGTRAARGGHDVRFRTDSVASTRPGFAWHVRDDSTVMPWDTGRPYSIQTGAKPTQEKTMPKLNLDGLELDMPDAATAQAINQWRKDMEEKADEGSAELAKAAQLIDAHKAKIAELEEQITTLATERDTLAGQLEAITAAPPAPEGDAMEGEGAEQTGDPAMLNQDSFLAWHNERKELEPLATRFRVDSADTLDNAALKRAICEAHLKKDLTERTDAAIEGMYEGIRTMLGARDDSYRPRPVDLEGAGAADHRNDSFEARETRAQNTYLARLTGKANQPAN